MRFDILTIFREALSGFFAAGILGQAQDKGLLEVHLHDLRDFTDDPHRTVDDRPYGGGPGMVMRVEPLVRGLEAVKAELGNNAARSILLSSQGRLFRQQDAIRWARFDGLIFLCGRYEGVDERVRAFVDEEISIGDFVIAGGEAAAAVIVEATARLVPGVVGRFESVEGDSFYAKKHLGPPQYTRPPAFRGLSVPDVLLSGDHAKIEAYRQRKAWEKTARNRPDLLGLDLDREKADG